MVTENAGRPNVLCSASNAARTVGWCRLYVAFWRVYLPRIGGRSRKGKMHPQDCLLDSSKVTTLHQVWESSTGYRWCTECNRSCVCWCNLSLLDVVQCNFAILFTQLPVHPTVYAPPQQHPHFLRSQDAHQTRRASLLHFWPHSLQLYASATTTFRQQFF